MGLLSKNAEISGEAFFEGDPLLPISNSALNRIRGNRLAIVFQDASTALNPYRKIGAQMIEILVHHQAMPKKRAMQESLAMLQAVKLLQGETIMQLYPHEISGGMQQRVLIAMALLCRPKLLIADEPTTALDVTTQSSILHLLKSLQKQFAMTVVFITHDLGVVAALAEEVLVLYAGQLVERIAVDKLFDAPKHPYTKALLRSQPRLQKKQEQLPFIPGSLPNPFLPHQGCRFHGRCSMGKNRCKKVNVQNELTSQEFSACPF